MSNKEGFDDILARASKIMIVTGDDSPDKIKTAVKFAWSIYRDENSDEKMKASMLSFLDEHIPAL